jgi:enoyl-CoA hydratase/carnithine racemase
MFKVERDERVLTVTLCNPPRNELSIEALEQLAELLAELSTSDDLAAVVVAAEDGDFFCAGAALPDQVALGEARYLQRNAEAFLAAMMALRSLRVPTIAAVNAAALGGGLELALSCDVRIADQRAIFALPECRLGMTPCGGATITLPALIGAPWAKRMILFGEHLSATRARDIGLVDELVPPGESRSRALILARRAAQQSPDSVRACKALLDGMDSRERWERQRDVFLAVCQSTNSKEGLKAFFQRRSPEWSYVR